MGMGFTGLNMPIEQGHFHCSFINLNRRRVARIDLGRPGDSVFLQEIDAEQPPKTKFGRNFGSAFGDLAEGVFRQIDRAGRTAINERFRGQLRPADPLLGRSDERRCAARRQKQAGNGLSAALAAGSNRARSGHGDWERRASQTQIPRPAEPRQGLSIQRPSLGGGWSVRRTANAGRPCRSSASNSRNGSRTARTTSAGLPKRGRSAASCSSNAGRFSSAPV